MRSSRALLRGEELRADAVELVDVELKDMLVDRLPTQKETVGAQARRNIRSGEVLTNAFCDPCASCTRIGMGLPVIGLGPRLLTRMTKRLPRAQLPGAAVAARLWPTGAGGVVAVAVGSGAGVLVGGRGPTTLT